MIRLAVAGAAGRMGRCVLELAARDSRFQIVATLGTGDQLQSNCDALIDFTDAAGTMPWLDACETQRIPMVIGATGHDKAQLARINQVARSIPIVKAANFSVGIQAVLNVLGSFARELGKEYDVEIVETHHRHKIDAPSGTALSILAEVQRTNEQCLERKGAGKGAEPPPGDATSVVMGRHGTVGERPRGQIGVHAVRMGDIVGQHEIHFSGPGETITIRHIAHSRETFAAGALRAAAWIIGKPPGQYSMRNVLGTE